MNTEEKNQVIPNEIAIQELFAFKKKHNKGITLEDVENSTAILDAIQDGRLSGLDGTPKYTLEEKILNDEGGVFLEEIVFDKTRIKPTQLAALANGIDMQKNSYGFSLKCMAFLIGQPVAILDKLSKEDFKFVQDFTQSFM